MKISVYELSMLQEKRRNAVHSMGFANFAALDIRASVSCGARIAWPELGRKKVAFPCDYVKKVACPCGLSPAETRERTPVRSCL